MRRNRRFGIASGGTIKWCFQCINDDHGRYRVNPSQLGLTRVKYPPDADTRTKERPMFQCTATHARCHLCSMAKPLSKSLPKAKGRGKERLSPHKLTRDLDSAI